MRSGSRDRGPFYHGTKADLKAGDLLEPGCGSNYGERRKASYVYLTATLDAATWGAELAVGEGPGRIYRVEPTGIESSRKSSGLGWCASRGGLETPGVPQPRSPGCQHRVASDRLSPIQCAEASAQ